MRARVRAHARPAVAPLRACPPLLRLAPRSDARRWRRRPCRWGSEPLRCASRARTSHARTSAPTQLVSGLEEQTLAEPYLTMANLRLSQQRADEVSAPRRVQRVISPLRCGTRACGVGEACLGCGQPTDPMSVRRSRCSSARSRSLRRRRYALWSHATWLAAHHTCSSSWQGAPNQPSLDMRASIAKVRPARNLSMGSVSHSPRRTVASPLLSQMLMEVGRAAEALELLQACRDFEPRSHESMGAVCRRRAHYVIT